jgi:rSAM/selenodomain-associated transferase 2
MRYSFSIVIPVLNEASIINHTIEHLYRLRSDFDVEVIVVDGDPRGATLSAIHHKDVIKVLSLRGRGTQMNKGASVSKGELLLFLHTDTELPEDAFSIITSFVRSANCVGGAFELGIDSSRPVFRLIERMVSARTRFTNVPYGDQAIFIKKDFFHEISGFKDIPLMEDVELMRRIKQRGYRICIIPRQLKTSPRRWEREGVLYCTLRNWALISLYSLGVSPEKLVKFYYRDWDTREQV